MVASQVADMPSRRQANSPTMKSMSPPRQCRRRLGTLDRRCQSELANSATQLHCWRELTFHVGELTISHGNYLKLLTAMVGGHKL